MPIAQKQPPLRKAKAIRATAAVARLESYLDRDQLIGELELQVTQLKMQEQEWRHSQQAVEKFSKYYSELFNAAPVGYVVLNSSGKVLEMNEAAAQLLQWKRECFVGESYSRFVPQNQVPLFLGHLRRCKSSAKQVVTELMVRAHDNGMIPVELISTVFKGPDQVAHYRTAMIDITERRRAQQALQTTEQNYRSLVNSIDGIVWEGTARLGEVTFVSPQAEHILGYPVEQWLHEPDFVMSRVHPDDREWISQIRNPAIAEGKNYVNEFRMLAANRKFIWVRNSVKVTRGDKGGVKLQGIMVNITELKETEEALREETRTLETLNQIGMSLAAELNLEKLVQVITDAGKQVTGAKYGAFSYKQPNSHGGEMALYTTSGTSRAIFDRLPTPHHLSTNSPAEAEREIIRIDDLLHDARAAKSPARRRAAETEPPVRSYLAIPVVSRSGEVLGGLLFGHPAPGIFTERAQHLLAGIAAEAGVALDNAWLYTAVSKSESHFRQLADAMPQIVWTARADGQVDYLNQRWYEFTGSPHGQHNDEGWLPFLHPEDCGHCAEAWQKSLVTGEPFQVECRLREQQTGNYRWHLIRAMPIRDEHNKVMSWFGTCTDIEGQKRVEGQVRELNTALERRVCERTAQLQASNKELEAFSYSVSHDLRAPLRSIDAFSQLVREDYGDKLDDQGKQYLGIVGDASRQMGRLIDDLLHLSRVTRSEIHRQPVDLSAISEQIFARLRQAEPERQVEISIAPNLSAEGDERLLRIALENLLNNAWKFTSRKPDARIEVGSEVLAGQTEFFVRDNGAGFDMAYAAKLFGAFQRLHSTAEFPGHGIGLATVQRIISRHGGQIRASGAVDRGATFYFTLPKEN